MAVKIGDVTIRIGATTAQLEADLRKAERAMQASATKFTSLGQSMTLGVTVPVLAAGAAAFSMASDYEESLNKVRVAFGSSATAIEDWSKTTLESIGVAEGSALDMAALFGDMATSMGLTQPAAADMSKSLVNLAGDLASFKNLSIGEVTTALAGVFTGETESLKRLGVVMTEANVQAFALEKGITKKMNAMSQAEKVALRYEYVLNATKNAQGDFARTSDGAANQMRIVQESVKQLGAQFGSVLLPILTPVIQRLNDMLKRFTELEPATKKTIVTVAALAATIGPLLVVTGKLISVYASIVAPIVKMIASLTAQAAASGVAAAANTGAAVTTVAFGTALKATLLVAAPYVAIIGAIAAGIYLLYKNYQSAEKAGNQLNDLQKETAKTVATEGAEVKRLVGLINEEGVVKAEKLKALKKLQEIQPEYFKGIKDERDMVAKVNVQYDQYITNLQKKAAAQVAEGKVLDNAKKRFEIEQQLADVNKELNKQLSKPLPKRTLSARDGGAEQQDQINYIENLGKKTIELNQQLKDLTASDKQLGVFISKYDDLITKTGVDGGNVGGGGFGDQLTKDLAKITEELANVDKLFKAGLIDATDLANERITLLTKKLELLVTNGFSPTSDAVKNLKSEISGLRSAPALEILPQSAGIQSLETVVSGLQQRITGGVTTASAAVNSILKNTSTTVRDYYVGIGAGFVDAQGKFKAFAEEVSAVSIDVGQQLSQAFGSSLEAVGVLIGNLVSGEGAGSLKVFFNSILTVILDFAIGLGKQLIALGTATESLKKLFTNPIGAIIAGVGLIAVATIVKGIISKGVPSLAIGTDLVKSDGLAMIHKGEAIVPADVAKGGFSGSGGTQIFGRLSGIDLLLSNDYAKTYQSRLR